MLLKDITKKIQAVVGVKVDGVYGKETASAIWKYIQHTETPQVEEVKPEVPVNPPKEVITTSSSWELNTDDLIDARVHDRCVQVLNVFETGKPDGDYSNVSIYKDGGGGAYKQITYGASQTTQDGNLDKLLYKYLESNPTNMEAAKVIVANVPTKTDRMLYTNKAFIQALKDAGKDPVMQQCQNEFFDETYFVPAYKWFLNNGFTQPLSMLVIYDSFIHSGGILSFLRKRFAEVPPANGGDEKAWIKAYVRTRKSWLANHSNKILRNTVYRMKTMQELIDAGDWALEGKINANGTIL